MCLAEMIDLPLSKIAPSIAAEWRSVYPLSLVPVEATPYPVAEAGTGGFIEGDAA